MTDDELQFVIFQVGSQSLALSIFQVERILRWEQPAALPNAPAFLEGVLRYGDGVVPVVDLRKRLDVPATFREFNDALDTFAHFSASSEVLAASRRFRPATCYR